MSEDRQEKVLKIVGQVVSDNRDDLPLLDSILETLEKTIRRLYIVRMMQSDKRN